MPKRDRRLEIMRATEKLFSSRRFHEITLDDVIHEARVGKGTIYRYFKNKDDLFFETAMRGFEELCDLLQTLPANTSFEEQLVAACTQIKAFYRRRPLFRMMHPEESRAHWGNGEFRRRWREWRGKMKTAMAGILRRGVAEGALRNDIPAPVLSRLLLGMLRTRSRDPSDAGSPPVEPTVIVNVFLRGAGAASAHGGGPEPKQMERITE